MNSGAQSPAARRALAVRLDACQDSVLDVCRRLVRANSENPPGDTGKVANVAAEILKEVEGAEVEFATAEYPIVNLVARLRGRGPGRRLVFNGHLDTYPVGDPSLWSVDPLSGVELDGRLYGRGVSDMKGGIACALYAFGLLAAYREHWDGELVVALAGDEETMGRRGTQYLLDTVAHASGDAMICGDAGSPRVLRFGEKGMIWLDLVAKGRAAHGAHVHLGDNAVERLMAAVSGLMTLRALKVDAPPEVSRAIAAAEAVSEPLSGAGESEVLQSVTVNCGLFNGGRAANLVPDRAQASLDIRLPVGTTVAAVEARIADLLDPIAGVSYGITRRFEPNWTSPDHEIVRLTQAIGREVIGAEPALNMRVGASDSRLYRLRGVPTVVCGLTPYNMGGPDEHVTLDDLRSVARIHALTAFDYLSGKR
jgi:succinyl-diaminopimelate desuccinylase